MKKIFIATLLLFATSATVGANSIKTAYQILGESLTDLDQDKIYSSLQNPNHQALDMEIINQKLGQRPEFKTFMSMLKKDPYFNDNSERVKNALLAFCAENFDDDQLYTMNQEIKQNIIKAKSQESPTFKEHANLIDTPENRAVLGEDAIRDRLVENSKKPDAQLRHENLKLKLSVINEKSNNSPEFERYQSLLQDFYETFPEDHKPSHSDYINVLHQVTSYNEETLKELNRTLEAQLEDALENKREEDKEGLSDEEYSDDEGR